MIVSAIRYTDAEWSPDRLLAVPTWPEGKRREQSRRSRKGPQDECELSRELQLMLIEEALEQIWQELSWPVARPHPDWSRTALGAVLGKALAAELLRRAYQPPTFGDFASLARAYSLRN